jgi:hypothetical protein
MGSTGLGNDGKPVSGVSFNLARIFGSPPTIFTLVGRNPASLKAARERVFSETSFPLALKALISILLGEISQLLSWLTTF